jgi:nicotinamide-nucleotide amidase
MTSGDSTLNREDEQLALLARETGDALARAGVRLVTAESCTGGWIAKLLTDIPGSSAWFERGFVTYSNEAKTELLGVPATLIAEH